MRGEQNRDGAAAGEPAAVQVNVQRVPGRPAVAEPAYATPGAAGLDLPAAVEEPVVLAPGERALIPTGLAVQLPSPGYCGLIFPRSGLAARHGITLANSVGVLDSDYTGEILCPLINHGGEPFTVQPGDRIAQLVFVPVARAMLRFVEALADTQRGGGGFGSTGVGASE